MTKELYIHWLENMIQGCIDLQGMEREKAIYQHCLKKAKKLNDNSTEPNYKKGFEELMCYFDSISDEEKPKLSERLEKLGL